MLRTHSLSQVSIEMLCQRIGSTIGACSGRFACNEASFSALIELAARERKPALVAACRRRSAR